MKNILYTIILSFLFSSAYADSVGGLSFEELLERSKYGEATVQYLLGIEYETGLHVSVDYEEAIKWYQLAAEQGYVIAQNKLGNLFFYGGVGVTQHYEEAIKWYQLAAEQGEPSSQNILGVMYKNGNGVTQDKVLAHMWFNIAASNGSEKAMKNRDKIESVMSSAQIISAQNLARVLSKKYTKTNETQ